MQRWVFVSLAVCLGMVVWQPVEAAQLASPAITAASAIVLDAQTGTVLYAKDPDAPRAPASLTKIITAIVAIETAPLDTTLTVFPQDLVGEASMGLHAGDQLSLRTALYGLLLASGNDAAMTIARSLGAQPGDTPQQSVSRFVRRENALLEQLGLTHTHLENPHGLDQVGHVATARDLAVVTRYALRNERFRQIIGTRSYDDGRYAFTQANRLLGTYPGLIGGKTGITDQAGYCLMEAAERDGHTVIVVLLGSTADAWYDDARLLLDFGFASLAGHSVAATMDSPQPQPVSASAVSQQPQPVVERPAMPVVIQVPDSVARELAHPWQWLVASVVAMGGFLCLWNSWPVVLGVISLHRRRRVRGLASKSDRQRNAPALQQSCVHRFEHRSAALHHHPLATRADTTVISAGAASWVPSSRTATIMAESTNVPHVVTFLPAQARTRRAIRLACAGNYQEAEREFLDALRVDQTYDFTQCPGFWQMPPAGYIAAARAYRMVLRLRDARSLLTVVRLSFGSTPLLEDELAHLTDRNPMPTLSRS